MFAMEVRFIVVPASALFVYSSLSSRVLVVQRRILHGVCLATKGPFPEMFAVGNAYKRLSCANPHIPLTAGPH